MIRKGETVHLIPGKSVITWKYYSSSLRQNYCRLFDDGVAFGQALDDADVLVQGAGIVVVIPRDAVRSFDRRAQGTENNSGVRDVFDLFPSQGYAQALGNKPHQAGLEVGILQDFWSEIGWTADFGKPLAKSGVCLLGHADEKHRLQVSQADARLPGERMFLRNRDDRFVPGDDLPLQ